MFCTNISDCCLTGCHVVGSVICGSVVCPETEIICYATLGLGEILGRWSGWCCDWFLWFRSMIGLVLFPFPCGLLVAYRPGKLALAPGDNQIDHTRHYPLEQVWIHFHTCVLRLNIW